MIARGVAKDFYVSLKTSTGAPDTTTEVAPTIYISKDTGNFIATTNAVTRIGTSHTWKGTFTATEMDADLIYAYANTTPIWELQYITENVWSSTKAGYIDSSISAVKAVVDGLQTLIDVTLSTRASAQELSTGIASVINAIDALPDEVYTDTLVDIEAQLVQIFNVASATELEADAAARFASLVSHFTDVKETLVTVAKSAELTAIAETVNNLENPDNDAIARIETKINTFSGNTIQIQESGVPLKKNYRVPAAELMEITYTFDPIPLNALYFTLRDSVEDKSTTEYIPYGESVVSLLIVPDESGIATISFIAPVVGTYKYEIVEIIDESFSTIVEGTFTTYRRVTE
jgi:hypothetical protein